MVETCAGAGEASAIEAVTTHKNRLKFDIMAICIARKHCSD